MSSMLVTGRACVHCSQEEEASRRKLIRTKETMPLDLLPEWEALSKENRRKVFSILRWDNLNRWDFDVWELNELTDGKPLLFLGWALLASPHPEYTMARALGDNDRPLVSVPGYHFIDKFEIQVKKLCALIRSIEADYRNVSYHNKVHAADVLQSAHALLQMGAKVFVDDIQVFSVLLAAAGHDVHHPGRNNLFQVKAQTEYAIFFNNGSCLEHMHASSMIERFSGEGWMPETDISSGLFPEQIQEVQKLIKTTILGTDMAKHFDVLNGIDKILANPSYDFESTTPELSTHDKQSFLVFLLHVADVSNPAKPAPLFTKWCHLVLDEFFQQGDEEKSLNLTLSPLCDRNNTNREGTAYGFTENIIYPSFKMLGKFLKEVHSDILPIIRQNLEHWRVKKDKVQ